MRTLGKSFTRSSKPHYAEIALVWRRAAVLATEPLTHEPLESEGDATKQKVDLGLYRGIDLPRFLHANTFDIESFHV